jgi:hypothetical protein
MSEISETSKALSMWAAKFLADNSSKKPKRTRRLSYTEAWLVGKREIMRKKVFGHYGEK